VRKTATLTPRQKAVLRYLREYRLAHGYAPAMREIMEATGITTTSIVQYDLQALERAGHIRRVFGQPRTIVLVQACPHCGCPGRH
jgi:repressor LexA